MALRSSSVHAVSGVCGDGIRLNQRERKEKMLRECMNLVECMGSYEGKGGRRGEVFMSVARLGLEASFISILTQARL